MKKYYENDLAKADVYALKSQGQRFQKLSINLALMRKVHFLLKSGFAFIGFFILLEVGYPITIAVNFVYR